MPLRNDYENREQVVMEDRVRSHGAAESRDRSADLSIQEDRKQNPTLWIDEMHVSDLAAVAEIERCSFTQPWSENGFRSALENEYALYLTVRQNEDSDIIGYCGLLQSFDEADIMNVAVRADMRGRGIGFAMLERLMELGRKRGIERFTLEVRKSNRAALCLYEKLGFCSAGVRKNFYIKPVEDAVIMWTQKPEA
ncbi:MAG: ribosomal protein S18-alanine N-acetyltransferase [Clostridiales bacterium]|nr:ribosomal protein S18-alanine N-acetyltransferase [Clostridiales bacterium]